MKNSFVPKAMMSQRLDYINLALIVIALLLSYVLPFNLFLVSYAVLGPLHYLTEINWLHNKRYYLSSNVWLWFGLLASAGIVIPKLFHFLNLQSFKTFIETIDFYSNAFLFLGIWIAIGLSFFKRREIRWSWIVSGVVLAWALNNHPSYIFTVGFLLPTLIHVYLFTGLFMLYGALKSSSRPGYASVFLLAAVPIFVLVAVEPKPAFELSNTIQEIFFGTNFITTNIRLGQILGVSNPHEFSFQGTTELKVQTFITFAYVYHYLNWFSKTGIIGWYKNLDLRKGAVLVGIWLLLITAFAYDYVVGFYAALGFSFLHVILEFPLNVVCTKEITSRLISFLQTNS